MLSTNLSLWKWQRILYLAIFSVYNTVTYEAQCLHLCVVWDYAYAEVGKRRKGFQILWELMKVISSSTSTLWSKMLLGILTLFCCKYSRIVSMKAKKIKDKLCHFQRKCRAKLPTELSLFQSKTCSCSYLEKHTHDFKFLFPCFPVGIKHAFIFWVLHLNF
jgi:hypothetical protein